GVELAAEALRLLRTVDAQHANALELGDLRGFGDLRSLRPAADPAVGMEIEPRAAVRTDQGNQSHAGTQLVGKAIDHEGQHVRALRITDDDGAALVPGGEVVVEDAGE